jgi:hypothetical protein
LKALAQSGLDGSQYVTDPSKLKFPLRGVTYVEVSAPWRGPDLAGSEGLLIIHNSMLNAKLENVNANDDTFRGLIIADNMFHVHANIIGAVVLLSPNLEAFKNCRGNRAYKALYSADAIKAATEPVVKNGTGWRGRVPILGWRN